MSTQPSDDDLTDEELVEDGDDDAKYVPGNPDDDGQDRENTERPGRNKHEGE